MLDVLNTSRKQLDKPWFGRVGGYLDDKDFFVWDLECKKVVEGLFSIC